MLRLFEYGYSTEDEEELERRIRLQEEGIHELEGIIVKLCRLEPKTVGPLPAHGDVNPSQGQSLTQQESTLGQCSSQPTMDLVIRTEQSSIQQDATSSPPPLVLEFGPSPAQQDVNPGQSSAQTAVDVGPSSTDRDVSPDQDCIQQDTSPDSKSLSVKLSPFESKTVGPSSAEPDINPGQSPPQLTVVSGDS